jgi:hypothetical protein
MAPLLLLPLSLATRRCRLITANTDMQVNSQVDSGKLARGQQKALQYEYLRGLLAHAGDVTKGCAPLQLEGSRHQT